MEKEELIAKCLKGNAALFEEQGQGAHYYVYSKETPVSRYEEVIASIQLPKLEQQGTGVRKNAYISVGIAASKTGGDGVDLGISRTTKGWHPAYQDSLIQATHHYDGVLYPDGTQHEDYSLTEAEEELATRAVILARPISDTKIRLRVEFRDANGNTVGKLFVKDIPVVPHENDWCRYYRFASLCDVSGSSTTDGTYMTDGIFYGLGIYDNHVGEYLPWGIDTAMVECAWIMGPEKCKVTNKTENGETFSIKYTA